MIKISSRNRGCESDFGIFKSNSTIRERMLLPHSKQNIDHSLVWRGKLLSGIHSISACG